MTNEYKEALSRSLDIPECRVVPFFGGFLRDLRALFIALLVKKNCNNNPF
jgi:hypothetical protein